MRKSIILLTILLCLLTSILIAQRFNGGIAAGTNFTRLKIGYNKIDRMGANIGFIVNAKTGKKARIGLEMLYSQNGNYFSKYANTNEETMKINAIEIPLYYQYAILKKEDFHRIKFQTGVGYVHIFDWSVETYNGDDASDKYNSGSQLNLLHFQAGITWQFASKLGLNVRMTRPLDFYIEPTFSGRLVWYFLKE